MANLGGCSTPTRSSRARSSRAGPRRLCRGHRGQRGQGELKKNGHFLELTLDVIEGPAKGRKLFDCLNLDNPSAQAVEIAQATLSAICHATGKLTVSDSSELHNIPMVAVVTKKPKKKNGTVVEGEWRNEVNTYKPRSALGAAPLARAPPAPRRRARLLPRRLAAACRGRSRAKIFSRRTERINQQEGFMAKEEIVTERQRTHRRRDCHRHRRDRHEPDDRGRHPATDTAGAAAGATPYRGYGYAPPTPEQIAMGLRSNALQLAAYPGNHEAKEPIASVLARAEAYRLYMETGETGIVA
jgi:hypothetical protein